MKRRAQFKKDLNSQWARSEIQESPKHQVLETTNSNLKREMASLSDREFTQSQQRSFLAQVNTSIQMLHLKLDPNTVLERSENRRFLQLQAQDSMRLRLMSKRVSPFLRDTMRRLQRTFLAQEHMKRRAQFKRDHNSQWARSEIQESPLHQVLASMKHL